jgi:single-stranded DNA-binding protein
MSHQISISGKVGSVSAEKAVGENVVLNFSVASNEWSGGEKKTMWVQCALWNNQKLNPYITVAGSVTVWGTLDPEPRVWQDKNGNYRASYNLRVSHIDLMSAAKREDAAQQATEDENDIPF